MSLATVASTDGRAAASAFMSGLLSPPSPLVFVGFARTYFLRFLFHLPCPFLVPALGHATLMTGWFVLFFVQTALVRAHRVAVHKRLGMFGAVGVFSLHLLLLYGCVAWDTWRHRRLHPAFGLGALLIIAENTPLVGLFVTSTLWTRFATWLMS